MSSAAVHVDAGESASATGFTTASITPVASSLYLLTISLSRGSSTQPTTPSSVPGFTLEDSGAANGFIDYDTAGSTRATVFLFRAIGSSLSAGTITIAFGYTAGYEYTLDRIPNVVTSGSNGADAIVQHVENSSALDGGNSNLPRATLAAFASSLNSTFASGGMQAVFSTAGTGFTALHSDNITANGATLGVFAEHRDDNDTSPDANLSTSNVWGIHALEIAQIANATPDADVLTVTVPAPTTTTVALPAADVLTVSVPNAVATGGSGGDTTALPDPVLVTLTTPATTGSTTLNATTTPAPVVLTVTVPSPPVYTFQPGVDDVFALATYDPADLSTPRLALVPRDWNWEEQLSAAGAGSVTIMNDLDQPELGEIVVMTLEGIPVWSMICEDFDRVMVAPNEESREETVWSGRGIMAEWARALTYPVLGLGSKPKQRDRVFDWTDFYFDDFYWVGSVIVATVAEAAVSWPGAVWADDQGNYSLPNGDTIIAGAPGDTITTADLGDRFFRQFVDVPAADEFFLFWGGDDTFTLYIDGCLIVDVDTNQNFTNRNMTQIEELTPGTHLFAWKVSNLNRADPAANPTGGAWELYIPGYPLEYVASSRSSECVVLGPTELAATGDNPPGMTPGNAIRLWFEAAQARGCLPGWTLGFNDLLDTAGALWSVEPPPIVFPRISTKVLTDGLTFLYEIAATYIDVRADPVQRVLYAWVKGTMNDVDSGLMLLPGGDLTSLEQKGRYELANVLIGEYNDRYLEADDAAAIAAHGRHEGRLEIGAVDGDDEAERVLAEASALYANPREEITVTVDGILGYRDGDLGNTLDTLDSTGSTIAERIVAMNFHPDPKTGRPLCDFTVRDVFLDE